MMSEMIEMRDGHVRLFAGDCREVLKSLPDNSLDSCVTDPPYALVSISKRFSKSGRTDATESKSDAHQRFARGFMGKSWDNEETAFAAEFWAEVYRVLKPGGHVLAFGGTRTYHRLACAVEDAGFEIRDQIGWAYGSGFPKSHNQHGDWEGWGTALKPAWESIVVARKPLDGTNAANLEKWGVGALNIDGCRVASDESTRRNNTAEMGYHGGNLAAEYHTGSDLGRWPANVIHDGSDEVLAAFPTAPGQMAKAAIGNDRRKDQNVYGSMSRGSEPFEPRDDSGSAARFFQSCEFEDIEWLVQNLNLPPVSIAGLSSSLQSGRAASALVHAVNLALPGGLCCENLSTEPSTSATPSELRLIATSVITAIQNIAQRFLREWQHERLSPSHSPVVVVAHRMPTDTMQITVSHWKSSGSADPVTFNITPTNSEAGVKDSGPSTHSRIAYFPKASKADRDAGLDHLPRKAAGLVSETSGQHITRRDEGYEVAPRANTHPTVKPTALMQYLCRLVTPPGGIVLDPFMGSGSTGKAAVLEGFQFVGVEREAEYMPIAVGRISWAIGQMDRPDAPIKPKRREPANDNGHADLFAGAA